MRLWMTFWACASLSLAGIAEGLSPEEVVVQKDIVYGRSGDTDLKLDIARPPAVSEPLPAVVCIHGGAWQVGSKETYESVIRLVASNNYVAVAVEYRLAPKFKWPAQIEDVKCAVRYLRAHAKELNVIPDRIAAIGDSAGGHLSLLVGLMNASDGLEGNGGWLDQSSKVQAVVNIYGPTDLRSWHALPEADKKARESVGKDFDAMLAEFLGTSDRSQPVIAQASPVTYIDSGDPPVFTFHGTKDDVVPYNQAEILHDTMLKAGLSHQLFPFEGLGHGLDPLAIPTVTVESLKFLEKYLRSPKPGSLENAPRE